MTDLPYTLSDVDFLQETLDFSDISAVDFENLVFHLLDEMGFSNIQWRKGGEGNSATDGGRDLEATFWSISPGISSEEKYWFEVKYRTNQLEKIQVQSTILNASGNNAKDHLVIITNKTISNPTLDWVTDFGTTNKSPKVTIWQGHDLELLLRKNPRTLAKFLPSSLSFSGRCKVIESRFSNLLLVPSAIELEELWKHQDKFPENSHLMLSAIFSEVSYGDLISRPWGMHITNEQLLAVFITGMANIYRFVFMSSTLNREHSLFINGLAYLALCTTIRMDEHIAANILLNTEEYLEGDYELPEDLRIKRYEPIFHTILNDLGIECSEKYCPKVHHISRREKPDYFSRFSINATLKKEDEEDTYVLSSQEHDCSLNLVPKAQHCPLGDIDIDTPTKVSELEKLLAFFSSVVEARNSEKNE